jgi:signal transduction histidine kinase
MRLIRSPLLLFGAGFVLTSALAALVVPKLIPELFSTGLFMPHSHCYLNNPRMLWLQGLSDLLIGGAYMLIAGVLVYLVSKARKQLPFQWMFVAFGVFIFSCGWTHFLEVWTLWKPTYWLSGSVKAVTAVASLATAVGVVFLVPHVFRLIQTARSSERRREALIKANRDLERAYQEMEAFSYSLSHDIRAPLRAVRNYSAILLEEHRERLGPEPAMLVERIAQGGRRMEQLAEDVLALSRLSRARVQPQTVDLDALVRQVIRDRPDLQPPLAQVTVESPLPQVRGDAASLTQCFANLLGNAVKFVNRGVTPEVLVRSEIVGRRARVWVIDNGIGIAPEATHKIFEAFQRLHSREAYEGTGIGLAIVRKAVERIGGEVGVESEPGRGSRFWLELQPADGA